MRMCRSSCTTCRTARNSGEGTRPHDEGIPYGVIVTGSAPDSAEEALDQLVSGLKAFRFVGRVTVEDATYVGGNQRYELGPLD